MFTRSSPLLTLLTLPLAAAVYAESRFEAMLAKAPSTTNALCLVDVSAMLASPVAEQRQWVQKIALKASEGEMVVSPNMELYLIAGEHDPLNMRVRRMVSVAQLKTTPKLEDIAAHEGGRIDQLGEREAVWSPRDFYVVRMAPSLFGLYAPADRQAAARWAADAATATRPQVSPFLRSVVTAADLKATPLVLAFDLEGALAAAEIAPELSKMESVIRNKATIDLAQLAKAIASVKGVTMSVSLDGEPTGTLTARFGEDVAFAQPFAGELFYEVLNAAGMNIMEVQSWQTTVSGTTVTMTGKLFDSGLRRLGTLLQAPSLSDARAARKPAPAAGQAAPATDPDNPAAASQAYFKTINKYINDLNSAADANRLSDVALWCDRYARKIDEMPILGVDPHLVDFGQFTAAQFRTMTLRLKDVQFRSATRMAEHSNFYDTADSGGSPTTLVALQNSGRSYTRDDDDNYGYSTYTNYDVHEVATSADRYRRRYQEGERRQVGVEEQASGRRDAQTIYTELKNEAAKIRRELTDKYKAEF